MGSVATANICEVCLFRCESEDWLLHCLTPATFLKQLELNSCTHGADQEPDPWFEAAQASSLQLWGLEANERHRLLPPLPAHDCTIRVDDSAHHGRRQRQAYSCSAASTTP